MSPIITRNVSQETNIPIPSIGTDRQGDFYISPPLLLFAGVGIII